MSDSLHDHFVRTGAFVPVELGGSDERSWLDCDLASLAENRLGDTTDPRDLDDARRADWTARATRDRPWSLARRSAYERCYWMVEGGERVGTIAVGEPLLGQRRVHVASFYVLPGLRGRGVGRRALDRLQRVLGRHRHGYRLDTSWCWQRAVRFYLGAGLWLYMWKRDLTFFWDRRTPRPRIEVGEQEASLAVKLGHEDVVLARARRRGDALELDEPDEALGSDKRLGEAYWLATTTLSLAIAVHGFPLVRSQEEWDHGHYADAGAPEALARRITIWEADDRHRGFRVETPRIPGLVYPTWEEFEAEWARDREEFDKSIVRAAPEEEEEGEEGDAEKPTSA